MPHERRVLISLHFLFCSTDITKTTEETLTPRDTTDSFGGTGTTDSLGLAIAECARSQNHSQSKIDAQYATPMNLHSRTLNHLNRCGQSDSETISSASVVPYKQVSFIHKRSIC